MFRKLFLIATMLCCMCLTVACEERIQVEITSDIVLSEDGRIAKFEGTVIREAELLVESWEVGESYSWIVTGDEFLAADIQDANFVSLACNPDFVCRLTD